ncbi:MAG: hypothetical protein RSK76_01445 [Clostridia bacterium]
MSKQYEAIKEKIGNASTESLEIAYTVIGKVNENTSIEKIVVRNAIIDEMEKRGALGHIEI